MNAATLDSVVRIAYLVAAVLFILGLKQLGRVRTARRGNQLAGVAMLIAVIATLARVEVIDAQWILIGVVVGGLVGAVSAVRVPMTKMPEFVAIFNGSGGGASALVAMSVVWFAILEKQATGTIAHNLGVAPAITIVLSVFVGALTLSGSVVAYLKLAGTIGGKPTLLPGRHAINAVLFVGSLALGGYLGFATTDGTQIDVMLLVLVAASLLLGVLLVIPIGGADMPVVISLLNSYSGVAAAMTGFVLGNNLLIISGAAVGAAGLILTKVMCDAMNRSLANVVFGGFGADDSTGTSSGGGEYTNVTSASPEEAAMLLEDAESVVIAPGYGLAVAQAQHAVREMADLLKQRGCQVRYAIHPVAGRMPGHMNVLLAEADVPYEELVEMDDINPEFKDTDVVIVLGANDVVNPDALENKQSPIYGMPILNVHEARTVFVVKRSLGAGFAGIKNTLFEAPNTNMVFGDAKKVVTAITHELKAAH
jgi:NAD(P) transhydrogenase subunit beta